MGKVVFTKVGSEYKKEYTVMGDAVNFASCLYSEAKSREIIVSEPVFEARASF